MAYVPKTLVLGRCVRCGKKIYRGDEYFFCEKCGVSYCPTCARKTFGKCQICGQPLVKRP
ncbi:hypothetical protein [Infirmifilum sp. SLHALR2]|nr:MAG: hypothetical protein B7L53_05785 [Thermofilum sp. NZ13]